MVKGVRKLLWGMFCAFVGRLCRLWTNHFDPGGSCKNGLPDAAEPKDTTVLSSSLLFVLRYLEFQISIPALMCQRHCYGDAHLYMHCCPPLYPNTQNSASMSFSFSTLVLAVANDQTEIPSCCLESCTARVWMAAAKSAIPPSSLSSLQDC